MYTYILTSATVLAAAGVHTLAHDLLARRHQAPLHRTQEKKDHPHATATASDGTISEYRCHVRSL